MLEGRLTWLEGARVLVALRSEVGLEDDADFGPFVLIESETDHLPIGPQRVHWSEEALFRKESDVRRAEEWAKQTALKEAQRLVERFGSANAVATIEILMRRHLQRACGQECVDWAIGMLERSVESRSLLLLAGLTPPLNHFEICALRDRALEEIRPPELSVADPVMAYVAEIVAPAMWDPGALRDVFERVTRLAIELGYPDDLQPFYNLHYAAEDLLHEDVQRYWPAANRENIDRIMRQEAERFVARHAV